MKSWVQYPTIHKYCTVPCACNPQSFVTSIAKLRPDLLTSSDFFCYFLLPLLGYNYFIWTSTKVTLQSFWTSFFLGEVDRVKCRCLLGRIIKSCGKNWVGGLDPKLSHSASTMIIYSEEISPMLII